MEHALEEGVNAGERAAPARSCGLSFSTLNFAARSRDLVTNGRRQRLCPPIRHDREPLGRRAHVTNHSNWNSYILDGLQDRVCLVWRDRDQQRSRRKQFQRIERECIADRVGFGVHRDALANHPKPKTGRRHQFEQPRREPTFGRIVHRVYGITDIGSRESRTHDTDAGVKEETGASLQNISINPSPQLLGLLSRKDGGALYGHAACQQDLIADGDAILPDTQARPPAGANTIRQRAENLAR